MNGVFISDVAGGGGGGFVGAFVSCEIINERMVGW